MGQREVPPRRKQGYPIDNLPDNTTHGHASTEWRGRQSPTYRSWRAMRKRCYQKSHDRYPKYGGAGITVCDRWRNSFQNFLDDMGERPEGMTIDRIDPAGDYEPPNCRWLDSKENSARSRRLPLPSRDSLSGSIARLGSLRKVAREYDVCHHTVGRWCDKHEISRPPSRRYRGC
jgi:hypothetical protein